jgi:hypothetical protein
LLRWRAQLIIAASARKHGVSDEDIRHAYDHPIRVFELDEGFTMIIGANHAAIIYEIGVINGVQAPVVVHRMKARNKFLR